MSKKIAAALAGKPADEKRPSRTKRGRGADADGELIRTLTQRLAEDGPEADRLRKAISQSISQEPQSPARPRESIGASTSVIKHALASAVPLWGAIDWRASS